MEKSYSLMHHAVIPLFHLFCSGQLRDYEWRLDQEAKQFCRIDEKRKAIAMDLRKMEHR